MKTHKAIQRAELWAANIETKRRTMHLRARENHAKPLILPAPEIVREAMAGVFNSRTGKLLANAPKSSAKPLAHVLHKKISWHGGGGNLGGPFALQWTCDTIAEKLGLSITGRELFDQIDTLAIVMRAGKSNALSNWARVLG